MWIHTAVIQNPKNGIITVTQKLSKTADSDKFKEVETKICTELGFNLILIHSYGVSKRTLKSLEE